MGPLQSLVGRTLWEATTALALDPTRPPYRLTRWQGKPCVFSDDDEPNPVRVGLDVSDGRVVAVSLG